MQLTEQNLDVERSEVFAESSFRIKTTSKAFKILSSGLYSDKIKACIRELSTNAADSHTEAGKSNEPFYVHLPNHFEPYFSVKDNGTGLSPDEIQNVYTTYFESTRSSSNLFTGALGLGSKSPFCYTDSFTVVSRHNGTKYTYTAFINEHGIPSVAQMNNEATDECNGIEVSFPVSSNDFNEFRYKAENIYKYFNVKPIVSGATIDLTKPAPTYTGKNWEMSKNAGHMVVMGNVCYPLCLTQAGCNNPIFSNSAMSVCIYANIGDVEMTASRESLEYTDKTKQYISSVVEDIMNSWRTLLENDLQSQPTYWDACIFYADNQLWLNNPTWGPQSRKLRTQIVLPYDITTNMNMYVSQNKYGKVTYKSKETSTFYPASKVLFIVNDLVRGAKLRVLQYIKSNAGNFPSDKHVYVLNFDDKATEDKFFQELDLPANLVMRASSLPKVKYNKTGNTSYKVMYLLSQNKSSSGKINKREAWDKMPYADTVEGVFVELQDRWEIKDFGSSWAVTRAIDAIAAITGVKLQVYGLREKMLNKARQSKNWRSLTDVINEVLQKYQSYQHNAINVEKYQEWESLTKLAPYISGIDLAQLVGTIEYVKKNNSLLKNLQTLIDMMDHNAPEPDITKELEPIQNKYPLLFYVIEHVNSSYPVSLLVDYINTINRVNNADSGTCP